jgi:hypothetical protein
MVSEQKSKVAKKRENDLRDWICGIRFTILFILGSSSFFSSGKVFIIALRLYVVKLHLSDVLDM